MHAQPFFFIKPHMDYSHIFGSVFGQLKVVGWEGTANKLKCLCSCGKEKVARLTHLRSGSVKSCGCLLVSRPKEVHGKHFASKTPEYTTWDAMVRRCHSPSDPSYKNYGARGIVVCDRWRGEHGFRNFLADMGARPKGMTLDRKNNSDGYYPENCRWADCVTQSNNRRTNIYFESRGERRTLADWSRIVGISDNTMRERLKRGWSADDAIHTPARKTASPKRSVDLPRPA